MGAGYEINASQINNQVGSLVTSLWNDLEAIRRFKQWLDDATHTDSFLTNTVGWQGADIAVVRNSFSDLGSASNGLYAVAHGNFAPPGASNYFFNAKALSGIFYAG